jgi:LPXTG-motif cell wall-anchored protein
MRGIYVENADTENQVKEISKNSAKTSAMPFWAWLVIIGGAVVAGGAVVFVVRRRKS